MLGGVPPDAAALERVRRARRALATEGPATVRAEGDFARVALPDEDGHVLRDLFVDDGARVVVEVGLAYGSSALAIAEALLVTGGGGASHVIIDAFQDRFGDAGWQTIVAAGLTEVCSLVRTRSQLALPRLVEDGFVADAAFVDGSHVFHNVFVDLFFLRELVRPGGLVVLDDCRWASVATAVRYFERDTGWRQVSIAARTRLRAYRLPQQLIEPSFESFEPFGPGGG
jgi:predicted O-methyltransferase YrrM